MKIYSFLNRGSDERQYCAPGIDLPLCRFSRSKEYPEYHTNKDDFNVVTQKGLMESLEVFTNIIDAFELGLYPKTKIICEPNLGKRNLYPTLSQKGVYDDKVITRNDLIAYSNGKRNVFQISNILNKNLSIVSEEYKLLKSKKILT